MPPFPPQFVADWDKLKRNLIPAVENMKTGSMITPAHKADIKKAAEKLIKSFDKDLKGKMKTLATAKSSGDVVKGASAVSATAELYLERLRKIKAEAKVGAGPFEAVEKKLTEINKAATGLRTGRPQAVVPKDFVDRYRQGMTDAVKQVAKLQLPDDQKAAVRKSAEKLVDAINLKVLPKANSLQSAADAAAAKTAADALVANTEMGRKLAIDWLKTVPAAARPVYLAIDFVMTKSATAARKAAASA